MQTIFLGGTQKFLINRGWFPEVGGTWKGEIQGGGISYLGKIETFREDWNF